MSKSEYAPDVKKLLSIVIDIDDIGEQEMRRQDVEKALKDIRRQSAAADLLVFSSTFSIREPGRTMTFSLDVHHGLCVLRLANHSDYQETIRGRRFLSTQSGLDLPSFDKLVVEDLLCGVESFILEDMFEE